MKSQITNGYRALAGVWVAAFIALFICCCGTAAAQQLTSRQVEASALGANEVDATLQALVSAVTQVNGTRVGGLTISVVRESARSNKVNTGSDLIRVAGMVTQGAVKNYEVLSSGREPAAAGQPASQAAQWRVRIRANVAVYDAGVQLSRLRIAIVPFRLASEIANNAHAKTFATDFAAKLESQLTQSRRFAVLDRKFSDAVDKELSQYQTGAFSPEESARVGKKAGTDYLVVGELSKYEIADHSIHLTLSNSTIPQKSARAVIEVRLIDVATGQIKYAKNFDTGAQSAGSTGAAESKLEGMAATAASEILTAVYPIAIVAADGSTVTLGQGGETIKVGQRFDVYALGEPLKDPYTGESLGRRESQIGSIEVAAVTDRVSTAKIIDGAAAIAAKGGKDMIVRAATGTRTAAAAGTAAAKPKGAAVKKAKSGSGSAGKADANPDW